MPTAQFTAAAVFMACGHSLLVRATDSGDPAVGAPFRYSRLLVAVLLNELLRREPPNALTWASNALLLGPEAYLLRAGRR